MSVKRGEVWLANLNPPLRVLDTARLQQRLGVVNQEALAAIESCVLFTLGIV